MGEVIDLFKNIDGKFPLPSLNKIPLVNSDLYTIYVCRNLNSYFYAKDFDEFDYDMFKFYLDKGDLREVRVEDLEVDDGIIIVDVNNNIYKASGNSYYWIVDSEVEKLADGSWVAWIW